MGWRSRRGCPRQRFHLPARRHWRERAGHAAEEHEPEPVDVFLRIGEGPDRLALGPLVRGQVCRTCGDRDVFLFDSLYDASRVGRFDLLDYAPGHKNRVNGAEAVDLGGWLKEGPPPPPPPGDLGGNLDSRALAAMLECRSPLPVAGIPAQGLVQLPCGASLEDMVAAGARPCRREHLRAGAGGRGAADGRGLLGAICGGGSSGTRRRGSSW